MALSEHKDQKKEEPSTKELPPFYEIPAAISGHFTVEIDDFSRALIEKGDSQALNLFNDEVKATLGQRYVMVAFIKDHVAHLRAIPGFEFVEDKIKRAALAKKAATFFKCKEEDIAFPDHAIWTGVVHEQLISRIRQKEPELEHKAIIVPFSMIKNNGKYSWLNRSARNADIFSPYPLANACYVFEEKSDYTGYKPPKFDLYYHLTRSIPKAIFEKLSTDATETICADDPTPLAHYVLDECTNFAYEAKWDVLRKLYKSELVKAVEQIQRMLMRNLHVYLSDLSAPDYKERANEIIINGLCEAEKLDIPIDIDFIPPEFEGHDRALTKAEKPGSKDLHFFLTEYKKRFLYRSLTAATENNSVEEAATVLAKVNDVERKPIFTNLISYAIQQNKLKIIAMMYAASKTDNEKESIIKGLSDDFCESILDGNFEEAKKYILAIPKTMLSVLKQPTEISVPPPSTLSLLLYQLAETFLEEKPDFNKKNVAGQTLLHLAVSLSNSNALIYALFNENADPNILDNEDCGPLLYAAKSDNWNIVPVLLSHKANPNTKEGLMSPLEYALESKKHAGLQFLLRYGALFPDSFQARDQLHSILQSSIGLSQYEIFTVLMQTIRNQKPAMQLKLLNVIYYFFNDAIGNISTAGMHVKTVLNLLQLSDAPIHDAIDGNPKQTMDRFFNFVETIPDADTKLELINAMLDSKSFIGQMLILDKIYGDNFCKELSIMQMRVDLNIMFGHFTDSIIMGNLQEAKECVKSVPSKLFLPYIQEQAESPYFMCRLAETLLEEKPDVNKKVEGETLLHAVAKWSHCSVALVNLLLRAGDPNISNDDGDSALSLAARKTNWPVVYALLAQKADPNISNPEMDSPLECALLCGEYYIARILLEHGAKFPAFCALESIDAKKIMRSLFLMILSFLKKSDDAKILDTIAKTIKSQEDTVIQSNIMNVIFDLFYSNMALSNVVIVKKLLQMTELPSFEVTDFDQKTFTDKFYSFLLKMSDPIKLELIDTVLDSKSAIGQRLLKTDSSSKMFSPKEGSFREKLNKMKADIELEKKAEKKP